jgi:hypothetical protein
METPDNLLEASGARSIARTLRPAVGGTVGLLLAATAQWSLDRDPVAWFDGLLLFVVAAAVWLWALRRDAPPVDRSPMPIVPGPALDRHRWIALGVAGGLVAITIVLWPLVAGPVGGGLGILTYRGGAGDARGTLTQAGTFLWLVALALYVWALADPVAWRRHDLARRFDRARVVRWTAVIGAVALVTLVAAAFRFHDLAGFPREMTSDHTEKLMDIRDILAGWRPVFLPGNAGREPLQFYWTALLVRLGLPWTFETLKLGMAILSTLTIPLVYWAGREVAGRRARGRVVALGAAAVLALLPWHLQVTRQSLRISLAALFGALALAMLLRALATGRRNDWLVTGLVMGVGIYGYTGFRPMLLAAPVVVLLRLAHDAWAGRGRGVGFVSPTVVGHLAAAVGLAIILAAPMTRYALDRPDAFWYRTRTRMSGIERPLDNPPARQLAINIEHALLMFNRTSDSAWFSSPPGRPALETLGGALLVLGVVTALARGRRGDWRSTALLVVLPVMLTSTIMSLAFPNENPSLGRAAGAIPATVLLAALPLGELWRWWRGVDRTRAGQRWGTVVFLVLCTWVFVAMAGGARTRVFTEYRRAYDDGTHPTREGAAVIRAFQTLGGDVTHAYIVGWPYSWDYRAIGIQLGHPEWNNVLQGTEPQFGNAVKDAGGQKGDPARKLYLVGGSVAQANIAYLLELYPGAVVTRHAGHVPDKDFYSVLVPGTPTGASHD